MTSFKRTQRKDVQKAYRVRNWREYETGLRARGSLTVWLGLTDGKLANWNSPRPTRRKPGRQRKYSNHAIETTVTLGVVFGLASRQTEGFLRSLLTLLNLDNDVPDHSTISRRKARLGKVASYERRTVKPVHLLIDSSGLSVHVGQLRTPPKARDYRKLHLAVDEQSRQPQTCWCDGGRNSGAANTRRAACGFCRRTGVSGITTPGVRRRPGINDSSRRGTTKPNTCADTTAHARPLGTNHQEGGRGADTRAVPWTGGAGRRRGPPAGTERLRRVRLHGTSESEWDMEGR